MDLTFQVSMQYCSLQHQTLLSPPDTSTAGCCFCFRSASSFLLELFLCSSPVTYWAPTNLGSSSFCVISFCLAYCIWGSQGKNAAVVCHSLLRWTYFAGLSIKTVCLGWPHIQFSSVAQLCSTLCDPMDCSMPGFPVLHHFLEACSNSCPSSQWCHPTISPSVIPFSSSLQSFPASGAFPMSQFFASGGESIGAYFSISSSDEYSGLISFRIDLFDLLTVQGTLKSLLQHHSSKAPILWRSAFFTVQPSHPYMTTGKTIANLFLPPFLRCLLYQY